MSIGRSTTILGFVAVFIIVLAPADVVLAHGGTGGASSDYRIQITGYDGDPSGFTLRVVELGNRVEIHRTTAAQVLVLGYEGEPYLRLDATGVWENVNSPAHYLNLSRFASIQPPPSATASAAPSWVQRSTGTTVRWHDHRTHWMDTRPPDDVRAHPDVERVIFPANRLDLVVDGRKVAAIVRVTWLPPPARLVWLAVASVLGCIVAAILAMVARARRWLPLLCVVTCVIAVFAQSGSTTRTVLGLAALIVALVAFTRRTWSRAGVLAAAGAALLCVLRAELLEHALLIGGVPASVQRVAAVTAMGLGFGAAAAGIVLLLSATPAGAVTAGTDGG